MGRTAIPNAKLNARRALFPSLRSRLVHRRQETNLNANEEVAICIPTYGAEGFIKRTLDCACAQTHASIRIFVSVDRSDDRTAEICTERSRDDKRIEVAIQKERLGWSRNANVALDLAGLAESPYAFLYFHDDIIEPTYVERLLRTLQEQPDAASAHCDLVEFGLSDEVRKAHTYRGTPLHRLVDFLMTKRGTTLRSLVRREAFATPLSFPQIHGDNHWTAYVFHMALLAAGPAIGVHEPLYRRWQRDGSLTRSEGWEHESIEALIRGHDESREHSLRVIESTLSDSLERALATYSLDLHQRLFVRQQQRRLGNREPIDHLMAKPGRANSAATLDELTIASDVITPEAKGWIRTAEASLRNLEASLSTPGETS